MDTLWQEILAYIAKKTKKPSFETWIRPTKLIEITENYATVAVKNDFAKNFLAQSFMELIREAITEHTGKCLGLRLVVDPDLVLDSPGAQASLAQASEEQPVSLNTFDNKNLSIGAHPRAARRLNNFKTNLKEKYNFSNYTVSSFNNFAASLAKKITEDPDNSYCPLYLSSSSGLGKTHLLHAIGNEISEAAPDKRICYLSSESFVNDFVASVRSNRTQDFKSKFRSLDLLLMDDIQFLEGKSASQEEFYHTCNSLLDSGAKLVVGSSTPVENADGLMPSLKSKLASGLSATIEKPTVGSRLELFKAKAACEEISIGDEVLEDMALLDFEDINEIEGALNRVLAYSSISEEAIDHELISNLFGAVSNPRQYQGLSIEKISAEVAKYFAISHIELVGLSRLKGLTLPRHIAIYLAFEMLGLSYSRIGKHFSGRKHSSIIHSVKLIRQKLLSDKTVATIVMELKSRFR